MQIFDVISEVRCVHLKRRFENIVLYPNFDVISEVNCVFLNRRMRFKKSTPMCPSTLCPNFDLSEVSCVLIRRKRKLSNIENTLWYQKATYTNIFLKKLRTVKFETTVETNNKSISRQTTMVFNYLHQTILIR